jgi:hypothetical protein
MRIISLVTTGLIVIKSSMAFTALSALALLGGLVWYYRHCRRFPYIGPVLAILPFFFAWRSTWGYFFMADSILLACIMISEYTPQMRPVR